MKSWEQFWYRIATGAHIPIPVWALRYYERKQANAYVGGNETDAYGELPPALLRMRTTGNPHAFVFTDGGEKAYRTLANAFSRVGMDLHNVSMAVDLGCGCGRVVRLLAHHHPKTSIIGVDVDRDCIEWCSSQFPKYRFVAIRRHDKLPIDDGRTQLCYAFSVFTHSSSEAQRFYLGEIARALEVGGLLICSTHGPACIDSLSAREKSLFSGGEIVLRQPHGETTNLCNAFHPPAAFQRLAGEYFTVRDYVPEGALGNPPQDLWVLEKTR